MLACKKCLEMEDAFCDFEELRKVIADKLRAKKAYELQEKVVQFALHEYKAFIKARNAFRSEIEVKTHFLAKTHFLEKSVAKTKCKTKCKSKCKSKCVFATLFLKVYFCHTFFKSVFLPHFF
jgi:hypothetical protein